MTFPFLHGSLIHVERARCVELARERALVQETLGFRRDSRSHGLVADELDELAIDIEAGKQPKETP